MIAPVTQVTRNPAKARTDMQSRDCKTMIRTLFAATATAAIALATPAAAQTVRMDPVDALAGYYEALEAQVELPVAPPTRVLEGTTALTRIAFGSCNQEHLSQAYWSVIGREKPQAFLFIGDNVYGDTGWTGDAALTSLRQSYAKQATHPEFRAFREAVPMLATWDDHDYGLNDAGGSFVLKGWAETIFETFWQSSPEVRSRPGVYESRMVGPEGRRTQIIMLDTRYFRSDMARMPYSRERAPLGVYPPNDDPATTVLGAEQWAWLQQELARPADLRMIVSSYQVLTEAHNFESWENFPHERARLLEMLGSRNGGGVVLLSGDRHAGGLYTEDVNGEAVWEITSSSLNFAFGNTADNTAREPDPRRVSDMIAEENYGLIDIDWRAKSFTLTLKGNSGEERASRTVRWSQPSIEDGPRIMR